MNLSNDRYSRSTRRIRLADGRTLELACYTYETHKALYDVLVNDGTLLVQTDCGSISDRIDAWDAVHYAIAHHYGLIQRD